LGVAGRIAELPSGTVTFLFSDVEGSTRLLTRLRDRYADVLGEHQRLLRAAFDEHDGREVHTEGDAFFVAFARRATRSPPRSARSGRSPPSLGPRASRCACGWVSTPARRRSDRTITSAWMCTRAARICAAGHGGQVLISSATRELLADELPEDVALRDLGEHGLKDLDRPEHLFQLVVGDLPRTSPRCRLCRPDREGEGAASAAQPDDRP
jgi:class 3 adenylate cyclase